MENPGKAGQLSYLRSCPCLRIAKAQFSDLINFNCSLQIAGRQSVFHSTNPAQAGEEGGGGRPDAASIQRSIAEGDFDIVGF